MPFTFFLHQANSSLFATLKIEKGNLIFQFIPENNSSEAIERTIQAKEKFAGLFDDHFFRTAGNIHVTSDCFEVEGLAEKQSNNVESYYLHYMINQNIDFSLAKLLLTAMPINSWLQCISQTCYDQMLTGIYNYYSSAEYQLLEAQLEEERLEQINELRQILLEQYALGLLFVKNEKKSSQDLLQDISSPALPTEAIPHNCPVMKDPNRIHQQNNRHSFSLIKNSTTLQPNAFYEYLQRNSQPLIGKEDKANVDRLLKTLPKNFLPSSTEDTKRLLFFKVSKIDNKTNSSCSFPVAVALSAAVTVGVILKACL